MKSLQVRFCGVLSTLGPIGFLPMPGTFGTMCAMPLLIGLRYAAAQSGLQHQENLVIAGLFFLLLWIIDQGLRNFRKQDPSEIVLDEVLGYFVTMMYVPLTPLALLLAFAYFRFFDIVKPLGIDHIERIPGAWGVLLDDVVAGIWAHVCLVFTLKMLL